MAVRFYKKEYLIAVYDMHDELITICDNASYFAKTYNRRYNTAQSIISRLASKDRRVFYHQGQVFKLFLIPLDPEEIAELEKEQQNERPVKATKKDGIG